MSLWDDRIKSVRIAASHLTVELLAPCMEPARVFTGTDSFSYYCDWYSSHYFKVMLDQIHRRKCQTHFQEPIFKSAAAGTRLTV